MSDPVQTQDQPQGTGLSPLGGFSTRIGGISVAEVAPRGMITLRGDLSDGDIAAGVKKATGLTLPKTRQVKTGKKATLIWMSPDEALVLTAADAAGAMVGALSKALEGQHVLVADVSAARVGFTLTGADGALREMLARLAPVDFADEAMPLGVMRRTRLAQVAAAIWLPEAGRAELIAFRSVAVYVRDLLVGAAENANAQDVIGLYGR